jgi:hypothetical protein
MVYIIHFDRKLAHAQHYIGFVDHEKGHTIESRLEYHRKGQGSKLLRAVVKAGIGFHVADIWLDGDRNFERKLKNKKKSRLLCPMCQKLSIFTSTMKNKDIIASKTEEAEESNAPEAKQVEALDFHSK